MEKTLHSYQAIEKLKSMAEEIQVCMFCTWKSSGAMYGRPMYTLKVEPDGTLCFLADNLSELSIEINKESHVCLNYAHVVKHNYLFINGTASASDEREKIEELWDPALKAWFPKGKDDARLMLVKVTPREAYFWDMNANKMEDLFSKLKSAILLEEPKKGEQGKLIIDQKNSTHEKEDKE